VKEKSAFSSLCRTPLEAEFQSRKTLGKEGSKDLRKEDVSYL
jgi:hypothetical protein